MNEGYKREADAQNALLHGARTGAREVSAEQEGQAISRLTLAAAQQPAARGNPRARAYTMMSAQERHGNRAVQRFVHRSNQQPTVPVQRDLFDGLTLGDWKILPPAPKGETDDKYDSEENRRRAEQKEADERGVSPTPPEWWKPRQYDPKAPLPWLPKVNSPEQPPPILPPPFPIVPRPWPEAQPLPDPLPPLPEGQAYA